VYHHIDSMTVNSIVEDEIVLGLVVYTMTTIFRHIGLETLVLEINQYVSIPRVR
jgi:hypothetical protein